MATQSTAPQPAPPGTCSKRTHPIPLRSYHAAVQQHFAWASPKYELREEWANGPALVKQGDAVYRVDHPHDLEGEAVLLLTSQDYALNIPTDWANELFKDTHLRPAFYRHFLQQLDESSPQALGEIQLVLALYQTVAQGTRTFWAMVKELDGMTLYPHALLAAVQLSDFEALAGKLVDFLITEGSTFLNEVQDGVFEHVHLTEGAGPESITFYIYPVHPNRWAPLIAGNSQH